MPKLQLIPSGVPGLDVILGGGFPERSFNLVIGDAGTGKTTLVNQVLFANATEERPGLHLTLAGEPPVKMLRYQQQFSFFDQGKVGGPVHLVNLEDEVLGGSPETVLERIEAEIERVGPAFVAIDSLTSLSGLTLPVEKEEPAERLFVRRLGMLMTRWEATTFLVGEFHGGELTGGPVYTVADGILRLRQLRQEDATVRRLEVVKLRGRRQVPGLHPIRITDDGVRAFPRVQLGSRATQEDPAREDGGRLRASFGIDPVDEMTGGGIPAGDSVMIVGPSGTGKSVLGMHFVRAGLEAGESVVVALFEEPPDRWGRRAREVGVPVEDASADGRLRVYHQPLSDLSVAEAFADLLQLVDESGATRLVVDSLSGLEVSVSDPSPRRVQEAMYRSIRLLGRKQVTAVLISEVSQTADALRLTPHDVSVLADDVLLQRFVEIRGELETVMTVVKMRRSGHSREFRRYEIGDEGIELGRALREFHGLLTGVPQLDREPEPGRAQGTEDAGDASAGGD